MNFITRHPSGRSSKVEGGPQDPLTAPDTSTVVVSEVDDDDHANDADEDTADDTVSGHECHINTETELNEAADGDKSCRIKWGC